MTNQLQIENGLIVLDELKYFIPPLQSEEWNQLQSNILSEGCREPLLIWKTNHHTFKEHSTEGEVNILIDGHNRYEICVKHGLGFSVEFIDFENLQMAKNYMIEHQLGRRNLNPEQIAYLRGLRYNQDKLSKGKYERKTHSSHNDHYDNKPLNNSKTIDKVADLYHVSPKTIQRDAEFAEGLDKLTLDLRQDILSGVVKVSKKDIQQLAKLSINSPISSINELQLLNKPVNKKPHEPISLSNDLPEQIRKCVPNALDFDLTIQIKGHFLIENNLTQIWKKLRGFEEDMVIDESFTDTISIHQAPYLGLI